MKCDKKAMLLYAVTDRVWVGERSLYEQVEAALKNGVTCIQLREKNLDEDAFLAEAMALSKLCKQYHVPFIVNDNVDIAIQCGADGVHVGQEDMSISDVRARVGDGMIIGVSAHTVDEALEAVKNGADYLGLGAVFSTSTKTDVNQMSNATLKAICSAVHVPTVAIGGISGKNILQLSGSGVDGVAVVSAIFAAEDSGAATAELLALAREMLQVHS
ncbi:thiamine phosphate synthase [Dehalobacterium formicoaceticum]|uniref:Thiamine-phosphate synthase n=1 Tax=Dehalobacterium formicoaceticum TaxID=51515 RepID=A0ABT1Y6E0_9FIRM|nr:thiamine phosphate synthase [Dehalobacterium formicoaceticum]MCR6546031.1 thiamine phosphate synthase [Dehalobacterium formicoaceticum]